MNETLNEAQNTHLLAELSSSAIQQDWSGRLFGLLGCLAMIGIAVLLSENRRQIAWRVVLMGSGLQLIFALLVLKTSAGRAVFSAANDAITRLLSFSTDGARFVFGNLVDNNVPVGPAAMSMAPIAQSSAENGMKVWAGVGSFVAFNVLPTILFFSAMTAILYYLRILPMVVRGMSWIMRRTMGTSGAESLSAAANVFVGQTEAPLLIRPFIEKMTRSELHAIMTGGFATVAGGVMAAYVGMLSAQFPDIAGHLLAASVMSAPAALVMSKIFIPETQKAETAGETKVEIEQVDANVLDAASRGTSEGLHLALNVGAMLIAFTALLSLINWIFSGIGGMFGMETLSLQMVFGWIGAPIAYLLGTPMDDALAVGSLLGTKTAVNEFVAYLQLGDMLRSGQLHHGKSVIIATYALCGFSNFASIGIQIGGLSILAPQRRTELAQVGIKAMIAGSLACFQTAAIAALVL